MIILKKQTSQPRLVFKSGPFQNVIESHDRIRVDYKIENKTAYITCVFQEKQEHFKVSTNAIEGPQQPVIVPYNDYLDRFHVDLYKELGEDVKIFTLEDATKYAISIIQESALPGFEVKCEIVNL